MPRVQMTSLFIERKVRATGKQGEYFGIGSKGLSLRVNQNGTRTWRFSYTVNGKIKRRTLGRYSSDHGLAWARAERDKAQGRLAEGIDPFANGTLHDNKDDKRFAFDVCLDR